MAGEGEEGKSMLEGRERKKDEREKKNQTRAFVSLKKIGRNL